MKQLHRPDLFTWSRYDEPLRLDPPPLPEHDLRHLDALGGAASIVLTTSDHVRAAREVAAHTGARLLGPASERGAFPVPCEDWLSDGDEPFPGLRVRELDGSKTAGELALVLDETTAIFGDAVRAHHAGALMLLPREKLRDPVRLGESLRRVRALHPRLVHVLVGDGWCAFNDGGALLDALLAP